MLLLFISLPFFWALYDQQGSRWTYLAQKMDTYVSVIDWTIEPEQLQLLSGLLILVSIPIFDLVIYPLAKKYGGFFEKPLQRMVCGCSLASISFVVIGFLQLSVQNSNDELQSWNINTYRIRVDNLHPLCSYNFVNNYNYLVEIKPKDSQLIYLDEFARKFGELEVKPSDMCHRCAKTRLPIDRTFLSPISTLVISKDCSVVMVANSTGSMPNDPEFLFHIRLALISENIEDVSYMSLVRTNDGEEILNTMPTWLSSPSINFVGIDKPGSYQVKTVLANGSEVLSNVYSLRQGAVYRFVYLKNGNFKKFIDKTPNEVSVLWQFFPYLIISFGEVMFSITGLSFAFSQAPESMKSILTAAWLLTISIGNVIDIVIINVQIEDKAIEFFLFATLMMVVTVIFGIQAKYYQYVDNQYENEDKLEEAEIEALKDCTQL